MIEFADELHRRHSTRLRESDYRNTRSYFVTICTQGGESLFGYVFEGKVHLNLMGEIVRMRWFSIPEHFDHVELGACIVMPNHVHGIVRIVEDSNDNDRCNQCYGDVFSDGRCVGCGECIECKEDESSKTVSIPTIIRSFKSTTTREINILRDTPGKRVWQRNYYERVIRDTDERDRIQRYIVTNPLRWDE